MLHKVCGSVEIDTDLSFPYYIGELGAQRKLEPEGLQGIKEVPHSGNNKTEGQENKCFAQGR